MKSLRPVLMALLAVSIGLRFLHVDADFPAFSGSLGEYADAGDHYTGLHSRFLTGTWPGEQVGALFFGPVSHAAARCGLALFGCTFAGWRFPSLAAGMGCILLVGWAVRTGAAGRPGARIPIPWVAMLLLASDAVWLAYSRNEKQEILGAFLLFAGACAAAARAGGPDHGPLSARRALLVIFFSSLAVFTKPTFAIPAAVVSLLALDGAKPRTAITGYLAGGLLAAALAWWSALGLLGSTSDLGLALTGITKTQQHASTLPAPNPILALELLWSSNLPFRSPLHLLGLYLAAIALLDWRRSTRAERIAATTIAGVLVFPFLVSYFPMRFRIPTLPFAAWLVAEALARETEGDAGARPRRATRGALAFALAFPAGKLAHALAPGSAVAVLVGGALGFAAGLVPWSRILVVAGNGFPLLKRISVLHLAVAGCLAANAALSFQVLSADRFDVARIAARLEKDVPAGTLVATNWRWGQYALLFTPLPATTSDTRNAGAFLLARERDGSTWGTPPPDRFVMRAPAWTHRAWFGTTYELYLADTACLRPVPPAML